MMVCKCGQRMIWLVSNKDRDTAFWCECGISCIAYSLEDYFEWHIPKGLKRQRLLAMQDIENN